MKEIIHKELNEFFVDTLQSGSSKILVEDDGTIEYELFENFDVGIISFLHEDSLDKLLTAGFIDKEIKKLSMLLREKAIFVLQHENRTAESIKTSKSWKEVFDLSDQILNLKRIFDLSRN